MPKIGMESVRRAGLVEAAIMEIGVTGSLDVTVSGIAKRAGVSSALAHHYFGTKEEIIFSAMRQVLAVYGEDVRRELSGSLDPRERARAIIRASFLEDNFRPEVISAWLNFYVMSQNSVATARLLNIYKRRLRSNLVSALRPLLGSRSGVAAEGIAAMIDGLYVRESLGRGGSDPAVKSALVNDYLDLLLEKYA